MAYTAVGSAYTGAITSGTSLTVASVNPTAVGDVLVVWVGSNALSADTVSSISHSGVTTWNKLVSNAGTRDDAEIWWGVVTATGSATLTVNLVGSPYGAEAVVLQFHSSTGGTWTADTATGTSTASASTGNYPSATPIVADANPLYLGCLEGGKSSTGLTLSGSTSGFTYTSNINASNSRYGVLAAYNLAPGTGASSPNWSASAAINAALAAGFLYTVAASAAPIPTRPVSQAVNRAANY